MVEGEPSEVPEVLGADPSQATCFLPAPFCPPLRRSQVPGEEREKQEAVRVPPSNGTRSFFFF